jgi:hypothetical protein
MPGILLEGQYGTFNMDWNRLFMRSIGIKRERMFWLARHGSAELVQVEEKSSSNYESLRP